MASTSEHDALALAIRGVGETPEQRNSAMYQADHACPEHKTLYSQCVEDYFALDAKLRLTKPIHLQKYCREPFINYKQCLVEHLKPWAEARRGTLEAPPDIKPAFQPIKKNV